MCLCDPAAPIKDVSMCITDFRDDAKHLETRISHEAFVASVPLESQPLPMIFGVRLDRFLPDLMHSQYLGTGKSLNGSILVFLAEAGAFGPFGGPYEEALAAALKHGYKLFRAWAKHHRLSVTQPRFTCARVNRKSRTMFPVLSSKAIAGKIVSYWLAHEAHVWMQREGATQLDSAASWLMLTLFLP